jgi:transposase
MIEIALGSGRRLRVDRDVDADALRRVLDVLDRR